jgi:hypothetical protein
MGKKLRSALVASSSPHVNAVASGASSSKGQVAAACPLVIVSASSPAVSAPPTYSISGTVKALAVDPGAVTLNPGALSAAVAAGSYRFDNLTPGTYTVSAPGADFMSAHGASTVDAPTYQVDLQQNETVNFAQTVVIQGSVTGVNPAEIASVTIELNDLSVPLQADRSYIFPRVALTTPCKLMPKLYGWKFVPQDGLVIADGKVTFTLRKAREIDFKLQTFKIQGTLAGMMRPKDKGIAVLVHDGPRTKAGVVDNLGVYSIDDLPHGRYRFGPSLDAVVFEPVEREIDLAADIEQLDFAVKTFSVAFEVRGIPQKLIERVAAKVATSTAGLRGNPIENVTLTERFDGVAAGVRTYSAIATVANIPAGRNYTASLAHTGFLDVSLVGAPGTPQAVFDLTENQTVRFTAVLKRFKIEGTCSMAGGLGKAGITLKLSCDLDVLHTVVTAANGHYIFPVVDAGRQYVVTPHAPSGNIDTTFDAWSKSIEFLTQDEVLDFTSGVSLQWAHPRNYLVTPSGNAFLTEHAMQGIQQTRLGGNQAGHTVLLHVYRDAVAATWNSHPVETTPPTSAYDTQASDGSGTLRVVRMPNPSPNERLIHTCYYV